MMILGLDFTTHNDDTLRADKGQVQDDSKNNDITEEDDDCQYISVISNSIHDLYSVKDKNITLNYSHVFVSESMELIMTTLSSHTGLWFEVLLLFAAADAPK